MKTYFVLLAINHRIHHFITQFRYPWGASLCKSKLRIVKTCPSCVQVIFFDITETRLQKRSNHSLPNMVISNQELNPRWERMLQAYTYIHNYTYINHIDRCIRKTLYTCIVFCISTITYVYIYIYPVHTYMYYIYNIYIYICVYDSTYSL